MEHVATPRNSMPAVVGMAATESVGSDRYACTVVEVTRNGREVAVVWNVESYNRTRREIAEAVEQGAPEMTRFHLEHRLAGMVHRYTLKADGVYRPKGRSYARMGRLTLGHGEDYRDPSY